MSAEKLAFLQNFYTGVTLYVPAEPEAPAAARPAATVAPDQPVATLAAAKPATPAPEPRTSSMPSTGFSKPSAGLERLTSSILSPPVASVANPALVPPAATSALATDPAVPPVMLTPFTTLGSNAAGAVLLCRLPREQFVRLHRNVFLNKMLQALGFVMEDVMLVNVESELPVALVNLRQQLDATHIIAFGKNLLDVTIRNTQIYEPVLFPSLNLSYLASATIDLVEYDVSLKKRLWPGLQAMFLR
ncbi:hypothetical protein GCM10022409_04460 [Hymenobacter glaciei]|uniref:Uncharacterized protein n=1 Tax=Hymenobacter glaciei TaxID=877209 RepID=A0ABP7TB14_9BACT